MNQDLLSRAQQREAANAGSEPTTASTNRRLNRFTKNNPQIKSLSDNSKVLLHTADPHAMPRKIASGGVNALDTTVKSTVSIFKKATDAIQDTIKKGGMNPNIKNLSFSFLGGIFGLSAIKKLLDIPKLLTDRKVRDQSSPLLLQGAKLLTGTTLAFGLFKTVLGGAGLGASGLGFGLAGFIGLNVLSSLYENPNGVPSKIAKLLGLREKTVSLMDTVKVESTSEENIEKTV